MTRPSKAVWISRGSGIILTNARRGLRQVLDGTTELFVTTYACPFDARYHWYQVLISPIYRGDVRHAITMHVDVSALQRDPLTNLPNRALFDAQLDFAMASAKV